MIPRSEQERVANYLTQCIRGACQTILSYQSQFRVEGLLGITLLDHDQVFLVNVRDTITNVPKSVVPVKLSKIDVPILPKTSQVASTTPTSPSTVKPQLDSHVGPMLEVEVKEEPVDADHPELVSVLSGVEVQEDHEDEDAGDLEDTLATPLGTAKPMVDHKPLIASTTSPKPRILQFPNLAERIFATPEDVAMSLDAEVKASRKQTANSESYFNIVPVKRSKLSDTSTNATLSTTPEVGESVDTPASDIVGFAQMAVNHILTVPHVPATPVSTPKEPNKSNGGSSCTSTSKKVSVFFNSLRPSDAI